MSPTYYNLAYHLKKQNWASSYFEWRAHFSERYFQFNTQCAQTLEFKHLLAQLVAQYCPQIMPLTYCINDYNWTEVIQAISAQNNKNIIWILKPALINNGQHLKIFQDINQIQSHYLSSERLAGEHVLQRYITNPHLLQGPTVGHKYSIRMFVVLTNEGAYVYPHGYFNIALQPYDMANFTDLRGHLTNEHLLKNELNVVQIPTQKYELFKELYPHIKSSIAEVIKGVQQAHPLVFTQQKQRRVAIFGFDFMVDSTQRVWLLEANHAPCFPVEHDHPLQSVLYDAFWQAVIASFVNPIAHNQPIKLVETSVFENCLTS